MGRVCTVPARLTALASRPGLHRLLVRQLGPSWGRFAYLAAFGSTELPHTNSRRGLPRHASRELIQEVAAQSVLRGLRPDQQLTIRQFAEDTSPIGAASTQANVALPAVASVTLRAGVHM